MKPIKIINKLNESYSLKEVKQFPDWIIEKILDDESITAWYCSNCNEYFEEPYSEKTDMEDYYGVGSDFSNHNTQDLVMCPNCKDGLVEKEISAWDIEDAIMSDSDLYGRVFERFEQKYPDIVGAYYAREGTHHCDYFSDNPEDAWETIKEMIGEGILKEGLYETNEYNK